MITIIRDTLRTEFHIHGYFLYGYSQDTEQDVELAELEANYEGDPNDEAWDLAEIYEFELTDETREELRFNELDDQLQEDLETWYNVSRDQWDDDDYRRLRELAAANKFEAWDCTCRCDHREKCGKRVFRGDPDDWAHFQGVLQVDYTSYPANSKVAERWCDFCRCWHQEV